MTDQTQPPATKAEDLKPSAVQQMLDLGHIIFSRYAPPGETAPELPKPATPMASGFDLCTRIDFSLAPNRLRLVPTGLRMALPRGMEAQIRPRSGLALKHGVTVLNAPGTIDADYRGEVMVLLINHGTDGVSVKAGQRIAQLVIASVVLPIDLLMPPKAADVWDSFFSKARKTNFRFGPVQVCEATPADFDALTPTLRAAGGFGSTDNPQDAGTYTGLPAPDDSGPKRPNEF